LPSSSYQGKKERQCDESETDTNKFHPLSENRNETSAQSSVEDNNSRFINDIQKQRAANERARSGIIIIATEAKYQKNSGRKGLKEWNNKKSIEKLREEVDKN
jgi:hypothetical protein